MAGHSGTWWLRWGPCYLDLTPEHGDTGADLGWGEAVAQGRDSRGEVSLSHDATRGREAAFWNRGLARAAPRPCGLRKAA